MNHPLNSQEESTRTEDPHAILGDDGELFSLGLCYIYWIADICIVLSVHIYLCSKCCAVMSIHAMVGVTKN